MREEQQQQGLNPMYDGRYRDLDPGEAQVRIAAGEPYVVRLKVPKGEEVIFTDLVRGEVSIGTDTVDDQVLLKSDGFPTYHLAAVVDDHLMEITHVIRGEEWLTSTPKHLLLYRAFGWQPPEYAHLPLIVNEQKKKLSKRDGDVSVESYRDQGYCALGLVNFLALLGWSPGDDQEFFGDLDSLAARFSLDRISKSPSVFDVEKLRHINFLHLKAMEPTKIAELLLPFFERAGLTVPATDFVVSVIEVMKERAFVLPDYVDGCRYFYEAPQEYDSKTVAKRWKDDSARLLEAYRGRLAECAWDRAALEEELRVVTEEAGCGAGRLIHPVRLAVSGVGGGPGLFDLLYLVGREECLSRIDRALEALGRQAV